MTRILAVAAVLAAAGSAYANSNQKYFPLKQGDSWTYDHQASEAETYLTVTGSCGSVFHVTGFPGAESGLWVTWSGSTLYAWRPGTQSWVALLRFGVAAGTTYNVTLDYPYYTNAQMHLKVKGFDWYNPALDRTFSNCVHFHILNFADGEPCEFVFAPNYGLVMYSRWVDNAYDPYFLRSAVVNGKKFGLIPQQTMESGSFTQYPVQGTNKVLVINSQSAWKAFYAQHAPGADVPKADFSKQTILVVLAGQRSTGGYSVDVPRVSWLYPTSKARVSVVETLPFEMAIQVITSPYAIVLLDAKVYQVSVDWKTKQPKLPGPTDP